jgi:NAD(P) transhydrogenase
MSTVLHYDIVVIGSGPAGQKAAVQGAKAGKHVAVIEREPGVGGGCVYRGTIPSKTLRESALQLDRMKRSAITPNATIPSNILVATLMQRLDEVVTSHGDWFII